MYEAVAESEAAAQVWMVTCEAARRGAARVRLRVGSECGGGDGAVVVVWAMGCIGDLTCGEELREEEPNAMRSDVR